MPVWELSWSIPAEEALRAIPWRDATRVDSALIRFATTGEGELERIPHDPVGAWMRVGGYKVRIALNRRERIIAVLYVWPSLQRG